MSTGAQWLMATCLLIIVIQSSFLSSSNRMAEATASNRDEEPKTTTTTTTTTTRHSHQHQEQKVESSSNGIDLEDPTGYFKPDSLNDIYTNHVSFDQYVTHGMRSIALVAGYDNDLHRYDSDLDLINSFERNLTYGHDLSSMRAHIDSSEAGLLRDASELTLIENELNQVKCARQLDAIFEAALKLFRDYQSFSQSKQLDLIDFFDSFGAAPNEQLMMGNTIWLGGYEQCQAARVKLSPGEKGAGIRGRYCVAHLRLPTWSRAKASDAISLGSESIKLGVCLPRACNSISMLRHAARIESLIRLVRLQQVPYSSLRLTQLFCLPDEASPLRQFSTSARFFLTFTGVWLSLVAYFSLKYELRAARCRNSSREQDQDDESSEKNLSKLTRVFALRHAWHKLFYEHQEAASSSQHQNMARPPVHETNSSKFHANVKLSSQNAAATLAAACADAAAGKAIIMKIHSSGLDSGLASQQQSGSSSSSSSNISNDDEPSQVVNATAPTPLPVSARSTEQVDRRKPNLAAIDGIKVISMIWLIGGHTMLFFIRNITNGRQFWTILLDGRFLTIMAGIFPVDSFFTATGVLTSYLKFVKSRESRKALRTISYWLEIFVHRYLRFMPMYLLVFWYTRDVSEYIGQGPMWDYATASTSLRSICKRESVLVPLLFQANFKPLEQHCVKPAWYLANDYQYLLITPIFMLFLLVSRWLGYFVISLCVCASLVMQFVTVYFQTDVVTAQPTSASVSLEVGSTAGFSDFEALANFRPMFATYVLKNLWKLYVMPYNRIPPYLIGLLTGHLMYYHFKRQQRLSQNQDDDGDNKRGKNNNNNNNNNNSSSSSKQAQVTSSSSRESLVSSIGSMTTSISSNGSSQQLGVARQNNGNGIVQPPPPPPLVSCGPNEQTKKRGSIFILTLIMQHVNINVWTPIVLLLSIIYLPMLTKLIGQQEGEQAKIVASSIIAMMRFIWSLSVARLIYLCYISTTTKTTNQVSGESNQRLQQRNGSFVISLLSSPKWKPFSKIGLSVLLIQWEVIAYVNQVQAGPPLMSISYLLAFVIISVVLSYALGLLVYLVFEFPMSQIEQLYVHPMLFSSTGKNNKIK